MVFKPRDMISSHWTEVCLSLYWAIPFIVRPPFIEGTFIFTQRCQPRFFNPAITTKIFPLSRNPERFHRPNPDPGHIIFHGPPYSTLLAESLRSFLNESGKRKRLCRHLHSLRKHPFLLALRRWRKRKRLCRHLQVPLFCSLPRRRS